MTEQQTPTDQELVQRIQSEDRSAFRMLFDRYYEVMLSLAISLLKDINLAKDVVQEVFMQIWKSRERLNITSNVGAYLKRATANRSFNHLKSRQRFTDIEQRPDHPTKPPDGELLAEGNDLQAAIQRALAQLPERCREVFILKRMEDYSLKEIATMMNISPKTAENQITKALKFLKEAVKPFVAEE